MAKCKIVSFAAEIADKSPEIAEKLAESSPWNLLGQGNKSQRFRIFTIAAFRDAKRIVHADTRPQEIFVTEEHWRISGSPVGKGFDAQGGTHPTRVGDESKRPFIPNVHADMVTKLIRRQIYVM